MKEQLMKRVEELKSELASGERMLAELEARRQGLQHTLLRIGGAIQVLEEECSKQPVEAAARAVETPPRIAVANG